MIEVLKDPMFWLVWAFLSSLVTLGVVAGFKKNKPEVQTVVKTVVIDPKDIMSTIERRQYVLKTLIMSLLDGDMSPSVFKGLVKANVAPHYIKEVEVIITLSNGYEHVIDLGPKNDTV